jgi:hypothetical protein
MLKKLRNPLCTHLGGKSRGQSLLELALVLPVLILILLGLVEVAIFIGRYLDGLDLTREAARFASVRDPFTILMPSPTLNCSTDGQFFFYYQSACVFSPPTNDTCVSNNDPFCNGMNPYMDINLATDDVLISVYTVDGANNVTDVYPRPSGDARFSGSSFVDAGGQTSYYWALSDHDADTTNNANWSKDCKGNVVPGKIPYYSLSRVQDITSSTALNNPQGTSVAAPPSKGFVAVEFYYCYTQTLGLPVITTFIPNPLMIHVYTLMPLPAAAPTATPLP